VLTNYIKTTLDVIIVKINNFIKCQFIIRWLSSYFNYFFIITQTYRLFIDRRKIRRQVEKL